MNEKEYISGKVAGYKVKFEDGINYTLSINKLLNLNKLLDLIKYQIFNKILDLFPTFKYVVYFSI